MNKKNAIFLLSLIITFAAGVFPAAWTVRPVEAACECHMPPFEEKQMAKYSLFMNKKVAARRAKTASVGTLRPPDRSFSESRPYEGLRPAVGERKILALLVDFDDRPCYTVKSEKRPAQYYEDLLFNESRGSMNRYFKQASGGKLRFSGGALKVSAAAGVEAFWYRSLKTYREWGSDVEAFEIIDSSDISYLASEVIENASRHLDFSMYDTDRDGIVSPYELHIIIFHSGSGQEFTAVSGDIWSHRSVLDTPVKTDGVMIDSYILLAHDSPLGVLCHETGHDLGLFDVYDTYSGASVLGTWSLMDRGAWNGIFPRAPGSLPALPSAYERISLGWIKPVIIGAAREELYLKSASSAQNIEKLNGFKTADAVKIEAAGSGGTEYLLFENRYKVRDTFDEDIPPLLKRENGIVVYHIDEKMPDRSAYQYANDSRNSFYRLSMAQAPSGGTELSYYDTEFSRYSSRLQKFHNGSPNSFRMNCRGPNEELAGVVFNTPFAHINSYEISFINNSFVLKAAFSNYNAGLSTLSAYLYAGVGEDGSASGAYKYYSELALFENEPLNGSSFQKTVGASGLKLLDSKNYFARFKLKDGEYCEERIFGPFEIINAADKHIKIVPAVINKGEVSVNVYLSPRVFEDKEDTEEVYYSYTDAGGYRIEKQIAEYASSSSLWNYRSYRFFASDDIASDIKIRVVSKNGDRTSELTGEVAVVRSAPAISHGVYTAPVLAGVVTIMAESDRKLFQAQLVIAESGAGTVSVGMYSRYGESAFVYYYNYRSVSSGVISYALECVDMAGNAVKSEGETRIHRFRLAPGVNYFNFENGTIELSLPAAPKQLSGRDACISISREGGVISVKLMPEEFNDYCAPGGPSAFRMLMKTDFRDKNYALRSAAGLNQKGAGGGYFELSGFGRYYAYEAGPAAAESAAENAVKTYAVPNPARTVFKIAAPGVNINQVQPLKLKIYDSNMDIIEAFNEYGGGDIPVSNYPSGVYFYSLDGGGVKSSGKLAVRR